MIASVCWGFWLCTWSISYLMARRCHAGANARICFGFALPCISCIVLVYERHLNPLVSICFCISACQQLFSDGLPAMAKTSPATQDAKRPPVYDLYAVVNHHGTAANLGHYTAYCRVNDSWRDFDDAAVELVAPRPVVSKDAYVLFDKKRTACATATGI